MDKANAMRAIATLVLFAASTASGAGVLPFIADDYAGALAAAKAKNVPLLIEVWAPW